ncbi:MAG: metal-dependent hydrolase [Halobacteria archaeon]
MMSGHALLAFSVAALFSSYLGYRDERALIFGFIAGLFAFIPDVDMAFAFFTLLTENAQSAFGAAHNFWQGSTVTHRSATHSLIIGFISAVGFTAVVARQRVIAAAILTVPVITTFLVSGVINGSVVLLFVIVGVFVAYIAIYFEVTPRQTLVLAVFGVLSHPFGDTWTGEPPSFLYPFDYHLLTDRVTLILEPTVNLVVIFLIEILIIWLAIYTFGKLRHMEIGSRLHWRAMVGTVYGAAFFIIPSPTLDMSYQFVFTVMSMGIIGFVPALVTIDILDLDKVFNMILNGIAAITMASFTYLVIYILIDVV